MIRNGPVARDEGGLSSLSAMPPVAMFEVSSSLKSYAAKPLHRQIVVSGTYRVFPSGLRKATTC